MDCNRTPLTALQNKHSPLWICSSQLLWILSASHLGCHPFQLWLPSTPKKVFPFLCCHISFLVSLIFSLLKCFFETFYCAQKLYFKQFPLSNFPSKSTQMSSRQFCQTKKVLQIHRLNDCPTQWWAVNCWWNFRPDSHHFVTSKNFSSSDKFFSQMAKNIEETALQKSWSFIWSIRLVRIRKFCNNGFVAVFTGNDPGFVLDRRAWLLLLFDWKAANYLFDLIFYSLQKLAGKTKK